MSSKKAVIWDLDATIIDSHGDHLEAWRNTLARHGIIVSDDDVRHKFGKTGLEIVSDIVQERGLKGFSEDHIRKIAHEKAEYYRRQGSIILMRGAIEAIRIFHGKGMKMAIATASPKSNIDKVLEKTEVGRYIEAFVAAEDITRAKPYPDMLLLAARRLGVKPGECIAIDDSFLGIKAANAAGMKSVAVATGEWPLETLKKEAAMAFRDLNEIIAHLDEVLA